MITSRSWHRFVLESMSSPPAKSILCSSQVSGEPCLAPQQLWAPWLQMFEHVKKQQTSSILLSDDSWAELALRLAMSNMCIVPEGMKSSDGHLLELGATLGDLQCMNLLSSYTWELPQIHQVFLVACRAPFFSWDVGEWRMSIVSQPQHTPLAARHHNRSTLGWVLDYSTSK